MRRVGAPIGMAAIAVDAFEKAARAGEPGVNYRPLEAFRLALPRRVE